MRRRDIGEKEAQFYRTALRVDEPDALTPYRRPALAALRELTGRDAAPTAAAWRELLALKR